MFNCKNCNKCLEEDTNFCPRCGFKQEKQDKCPVCFEIKETQTLICGHNICDICINRCYLEKKECPVCRESIEKCPECYKFRVVELRENEKKCLDCKTKILNHNIPPRNKIICIECKSKRVLFDPMTLNYHCSDCFAYYVGNHSHVVPVPKTKICMVCFSNQIEFFDHPIVEDEYDRLVLKNKCRNCEKENVETKIISLEDYSKLIIKTKKEVNPDILKICPNCNSKDIYSVGLDINPTFNCNRCENKYFIPKFVKI